ncbi:MAG: RluA family pseudouridine synthase [Chitinivibrionales bacterium]|nr:RluA family pseudouridine synthase [Chitinivibrionales bacterium]
MIKLILGANDAGSRLDRYLRKHLALKSLSAIYHLIRRGDVKINEKKAKADYRIHDGDVLEIPSLSNAELVHKKTAPSTQIKNLVNTDFFNRNFKIIFEDETLILCNKPVRLAVHPGTGHLKSDTLIDCAKSYILSKTTAKNYIEPVLVHRLDKETSGIIMIAKNKQVLRKIHHSLRQGDITKEYIALCHGVPQSRKGTISLGLERTHTTAGGTKMKVSTNGTGSQSRYKVTWNSGHISELSILLDTGKTHQIRIHTAHEGFPIIGDMRYGDREQDKKIFTATGCMQRMYLHAYQLTFPHPVTRVVFNFTAPIPDEFGRLKNAIKNRRFIANRR